MHSFELASRLAALSRRLSRQDVDRDAPPPGEGRRPGYAAQGARPRAAERARSGRARTVPNGLERDLWAEEDRGFARFLDVRPALTR